MGWDEPATLPRSTWNPSLQLSLLQTPVGRPQVSGVGWDGSHLTAQPGEAFGAVAVEASACQGLAKAAHQAGVAGTRVHLQLTVAPTKATRTHALVAIHEVLQASR